MCEDTSNSSPVLMTEIIREALKKASCRNESVMINVDGVKMAVYPDGDEALICRDWLRAAVGNHSVLDPPDPILTHVEERRDAAIDAQYERRRRQWQGNREHAMECSKLLGKLDNAPRLTLRSKSLWFDPLRAVDDVNIQQNTFTSLYEIAILEYVVRWGRLMQIHFRNRDAFLVDFADSASREADIVDGTMYSSVRAVAATILEDAWLHGERLLQWRQSGQLIV